MYAQFVANKFKLESALNDIKSYFNESAKEMEKEMENVFVTFQYLPNDGGLYLCFEEKSDDYPNYYISLSEVLLRSPRGMVKMVGEELSSKCWPEHYLTKFYNIVPLIMDCAGSFEPFVTLLQSMDPDRDN